MATIKVFQINEDDWMAGGTLEECKAEHIKNYDGDAFEPADFEDAHELCEETMNRLKFTDEDGGQCTFREQLDKMIAEGATFPTFFASTNY
jgi:hypothetical protein